LLEVVSWSFRTDLLSLAAEVWWHETRDAQAIEGPEERERAAEEDVRLTTLDALRVIDELGLINNSSGEAEAVDADLQAWSVT
jgi:hypothetical protein